MTPCGAAPAGRSASRTSPVVGSSQPRVPFCWPVYQMPPSEATATSCGCEPGVTGNRSTSNVRFTEPGGWLSGAIVETALPADGLGADGAAGAVVVTGAGVGGTAVALGWQAASRSATRSPAGRSMGFIIVDTRRYVIVTVSGSLARVDLPRLCHAAPRRRSISAL